MNVNLYLWLFCLQVPCERGLFLGSTSRGGAPRRAGAGGGSTLRVWGQTSGNCTDHINHVNSLFQALNQEVVHPKKTEQEVGGQGDRLRSEYFAN